MFKLIRGEFYRLLHKKSAYIFFGALAVGYFFIAFIRSGGFDDESVLSDAVNLFMFLPPVAGGFLFSAIYTDDLNSKNLTALVGSGINKTKIVIAKLILTVLTGAAVFSLAPLYHCAAYALLGQTAPADVMKSVYIVSMRYFLLCTAFTAVSGVAVYGLQRATFAIVLYVLLAFNVVGGLLASALRTFAPGLTIYLASGIAGRIITGVMTGAPVLRPIAEYLFHLAFMTALSAIAFHKKEMEF